MKIKPVQTLAITTTLIASLLLVSSAFAAPQTNTRPGWGFGDLNHVHVGPPGSVHPINLNQTQNVSISNNISVSSNTGGNSGNSNNGAVNIVINLIQTIGSNIFNF